MWGGSGFDGWRAIGLVVFICSFAFPLDWFGALLTHPTRSAIALSCLLDLGSLDIKSFSLHHRVLLLSYPPPPPPSFFLPSFLLFSNSSYSYLRLLRPFFFPPSSPCASDSFPSPIPFPPLLLRFLPTPTDQLASVDTDDASVILVFFRTGFPSFPSSFLFLFTLLIGTEAARKRSRSTAIMRLPAATSLGILLISPTYTLRSLSLTARSSIIIIIMLSPKSNARTSRTIVRVSPSSRVGSLYV